MVLKSNPNKRQKTALVIAKGLSISLLTTTVAVMLSAKAVSASIVSEENLIYCVMAVLVVSSATGIAVTDWKEGLFIPPIISACYIAVLFAITALFLGGQYQGVWMIVIAIMSGCALGMILKKARISKRKLRRTKISRR